MRNDIREILVGQTLYDQKEINAVNKVLKEGWLGVGKYTDFFEKRVAKYVGHKYAIATNSGSSALLLAVQSLNLPKGSKVIVCACGFPATVAPILHAGLIPVFVDAEMISYSINPYSISGVMLNHPDTKAIVFAHTVGNVANMDLIMEAAKRFKLIVIEDICLAAGTKVKTSKGDKNIEDIKVGEFVLTRKGYKKVLESKQTGLKKVITRFGITGTPDHPIITTQGEVRLDTLSVSDTIYTWNQAKSFIEKKHITANQVLQEDNIGFITTGTQNQSHSLYIDKSGLIILGQYLQDMLYTIKTTILLIISQIIYNFFPLPNTPVTILANQNNLQKRGQTLSLSEIRRRYGTAVKMEKSGIVNMENKHGWVELPSKQFAKYVQNLIKLSSQLDQKIVHQAVKTKVAVYNLKIEGANEFFANNILVHNCDALGAKWSGKQVGSFGDIACLSFYPSHHITAGGLGGMCLTSNEQYAKDIISLRDWGKMHETPEYYNAYTTDQRYFIKVDGIDYDYRYSYTHIGYNLKPSDLNSAFGLVQMDRLNSFIKKRNDNFRKIHQLFFPYLEYFDLPLYHPQAEPSWFNFPVVVAEEGARVKDGKVERFPMPFTRDELVKYFESKKIRCRLFFAGNITRHPAFKGKGIIIGDLPVSDYLMKNAFLIACHPKLTDADITYIGDTLQSFINQEA